MSSINWKNSILKKNDTLKKAIEVLGKGGLRIVMVSDENERLLGTITDGDIRRALISNIDLSTTVDKVMFTKPTSASISDSREKILSIIKESLKNADFTDKIQESSLSVPLKEAREKFEKEYLTLQLKKFNGNISKTANFVGMERSALHRKLKGLGIKEFN